MFQLVSYSPDGNKRLTQLSLPDPLKMRLRRTPCLMHMIHQSDSTGKDSRHTGRDSERLQRIANRRQKVSLADVIVPGGCAVVEEGAKRAGHKVTVPFTPGRTDASEAQTDVHSVSALEPKADGFRNYVKSNAGAPVAERLLDRAQLLTLSAPEMTVLIGGLRVLNANVGQAAHGVFTKQPGTLSNDFFVNLLDMDTTWRASAAEGVYEGLDSRTNTPKWSATGVDLIFRANSQLRALAEVYARDDTKVTFADDFVATRTKVMNLDRYDLV